MTPQLFNLIALIILAVLHLPALAQLLGRRAGQDAAAALFSVYLIFNMFLTAAEGFWRGGQLTLNAQTALGAQIFGAFILSILAFIAIRYFVRRSVSGWIITGVLWGAIFFVIRLNLLQTGETLWTNGNFTLASDQLAWIWLEIGWAIFTFGAFANIRSAHNRSRQPLLRNRLNYWTPVFLLILINDVLLFIGLGIAGNPLRLLAAVVGAMIIVTHDPPDLREVARRILTYVITTLVILIFYIAGTTASQTVFNALPLYNPLLVGAGIALILALIFTSLLAAVRRVVNRWFNLQEFNPSRTLHAYSEQISNILDMQRLASVAVGLIIEAMDISRGFLFLVDSDIVNGEKLYRLRAVRNQGERQIRIVALRNDHPIAKYFVAEQRPLLQYDLDLLPAFRSVTQPDREWFNRLEAEVYLPIFSKREWIGLFALGAKIAGTRYTEEDLVTLSALANQTAVALENARLVDNLVQLNTELRQAYHNLDKANRDLERLDQTKSDFISIASHELRTPLTTIIGYTGMLIEDQTLPASVHSILTNISKGTLRLHEIMDSMFDIAQLDARAMQPHVTPVDAAALIREVGAGIERTLKERRQVLTLDIPSLPMVKADPNLLKKLFQHLLNNAIKFTPNDGKIKVEAHQITNNSDFPNGGVEFIVSDTGIGIDSESREIIFSKFYQPSELNKHSTSKTRFKGSGAGLGLALSKGIVEAHGGRIWAESAGYDEEKFPGSQFHVTLPLSDANDRIALWGNDAKLQIG